METMSVTTKNSKTQEPHNFFLKLPKRLNLRISNKQVALQNLSIYYTRNIRQQLKANNL